MEFQTHRWSIEEAVLEILRNADLEEMTEYKVRTLAADRLGVDLSPPDRKRFVRSVVESFLASHKEDPSDAAETPLEDQQQVEGLAADKEEEEEEAKKEEEDRRRRRAPKEYDDEGNLIVCRLSKKRRVTVHEFRGKTLVSIREFYEKEGKQLPTAKGISLTVEQWEAFAKAVPAIEDAVNKMADENLRMILASLPEAVEACMDAAGHEFDVSRQRTLLRAASYGRAFCRFLCC